MNSWVKIELYTNNLKLADFLKTNLTKYAAIWVTKAKWKVFLLDKLENYT